MNFKKISVIFLIPFLYLIMGAGFADLTPIDKFKSESTKFNAMELRELRSLVRRGGNDDVGAYLKLILSNPLSIYGFHSLPNYTTKMKNRIIKIDQRFEQLDKQVDRVRIERLSKVLLIIQFLIKNKNNINDAMLGYTLLYPYTENILDNPNVEYSRKIEFLDLIDDVILGNKDAAELKFFDKNIVKAFTLLKSAYDPKTFPDLYKTLALLNDGQRSSLRQDPSYNTLPSVEELYQITFQKGSNSTLAAALIVGGHETPKDSWSFFSEWGFLLQLVDDLEDIEVDLNLNRTIFHDFYGIEARCIDPLVVKLVKRIRHLFRNRPKAIKSIWNLQLAKFLEDKLIYAVISSAKGLDDYISNNFLQSLGYNTSSRNNKCIP